MPEGDAVHRLARAFAELFGGHVCALSSPQGRFAASATRITGRRMVNVRAVGKHLFVGFAPADIDDEPAQLPQAILWLHVHLSLYGSWRFSTDETLSAPTSIGAPRVAPPPGPTGHSAERWHQAPSRRGLTPALARALDSAREAVPTDGIWQPPEPIGQVRVRIATDHVVADLSGPTRCDLITNDERIAAEAKLGPDPLAVGAATDRQAQDRFVQAIRSRKRAVGELIMDQSIIAGVGNIYRAEALFIVGISPHRTGARVSVARLRTLWDVICQLMARGLDLGRIVTVDPNDAPEPPLPEDPEASRFYVYHRTGRPCLRCGGPVAEAPMQGRRLFWCPGCQH